MKFRRLSILCVMSVVLLGWLNTSEAGSTRLSGGKSTGKQVRNNAPKFTPAMWAIAKKKYQADTAHLQNRAIAAPPPTPVFQSPQTTSATPGGASPIAIPPAVKPANRTWSMTATRGARNSIDSRRSISSDSTASSASGLGRR